MEAIIRILSLIQSGLNNGKIVFCEGAYLWRGLLLSSALSLYNELLVVICHGHKVNTIQHNTTSTRGEVESCINQERIPSILNYLTILSGVRWLINPKYIKSSSNWVHPGPRVYNYKIKYNRYRM